MEGDARRRRPRIPETPDSVTMVKAPFRGSKLRPLLRLTGRDVSPRPAARVESRNDFRSLPHLRRHGSHGDCRLAIRRHGHEGLEGSRAGLGCRLSHAPVDLGLPTRWVIYGTWLSSESPWLFTAYRIDRSPHDHSRRWFRFSLRTMLVGVTLCGCWLAWESSIVRGRKHVVAWVQEHGGTVYFGDQLIFLELTASGSRRMHAARIAQIDDIKLQFPCFIYQAVAWRCADT